MAKEKTKDEKHLVDPDDISKRIFTEALKGAVESYGGSVWKLSKDLGVGSNVYAWLNGHMPPYVRMQSMYPKLVQLSGENHNGKSTKRTV